jgi:AraC-like DNA-binding protein
MDISLTGLLYILIIFQLLILCFFLFTQPGGKRTSNRLLACFFFSICLNLLDVLLLNTGVYDSYPQFAGWGSCLPLLFGPLLYLYTRSVVYKDFSFDVKKWVHFIPFIFFFLLTESAYLMQSRGTQEAILKSISASHFDKAFSYVSIAVFIQFMMYAISSLRLVYRYQQAASQSFSSPRQTDASWLYSTIIFFILIMLITTANSWLTQTGWAKYYLIAFNIIILALLVFVIRVLMRALRQSDFFSFSIRDEDRDPASSKSNPPASGMAVNDSLVQILIQHMQSHKPYLAPELTLDQLASQLSLKPRVLSQTINEGLNQTFFDFINRYRIKEATRLLTNPVDKKITILEVLYEVGFNSKSSFNTLFKKYTGLTPTEFRNTQA